MPGTRSAAAGSTTGPVINVLQREVIELLQTRFRGRAVAELVLTDADEWWTSQQMTVFARSAECSKRPTWISCTLVDFPYLGPWLAKRSGGRAWTT
jgi:hypothetical protein